MPHLEDAIKTSQSLVALIKDVRSLIDPVYAKRTKSNIAVINAFEKNDAAFRELISSYVGIFSDLRQKTLHTSSIQEIPNILEDARTERIDLILDRSDIHGELDGTINHLTNSKDRKIRAVAAHLSNYVRRCEMFFYDAVEPPFSEGASSKLSKTIKSMDKIMLSVDWENTSTDELNKIKTNFIEEIDGAIRRLIMRSEEVAQERAMLKMALLDV